ncbi:MAG: histidine--tRNA ligase [Candidatus Roizmanbacteria bacterium]|nr:histidine--tRNA ligase [Candidatus Roizmanbacteria bacterium]
MKTIQPRTLKGFRDFLPEDMRIRQQVIGIFKEVFESYGYEPLETPTLEHADILLGKYGEEAEQLIYQFEDRGGRKVAMKYDLTVPTCRVVAQYGDKIPLPFKRYQIQPVWRADNTQKGRFREFYQCDADTIGSPSMLADAEFILMGLQIMKRLGFSDFVARINNRKFIDGLVQYAGATQDQFYTICIAVDKMEKIGVDGVVKEMEQKNVSKEVIAKIVEIISLKGSNTELVTLLKQKMKEIPVAIEGLNELEQLFLYLKNGNAPEQQYMFDLSIIRGLSYYTGPVWEFTVRDGGVGSVAGCGRYDKLVGLYLGRDIPATGGSFGIERLFEVIKDRQLLGAKTNDTILVSIFSPELAAHLFSIAEKLRTEGKNVVLYPDENAKLEKQLKYANKKGFETVCIMGPEEVEKKQLKMKNMKTGEQTIVQL